MAKVADTAICLILSAILEVSITFRCNRLPRDLSAGDSFRKDKHYFPITETFPSATSFAGGPGVSQREAERVGVLDESGPYHVERVGV